MPTLAGFLLFIRNIMGITAAQLPDNSPYITDAYAMAGEIVSDQMAVFSQIIYTRMYYNFGADYLLNNAQDTSPSTVFTDTRRTMNLNGFVAGVITNAGDDGTGAAITPPDSMKNLTLSDLQLLKTTYGRQYLADAQRLGELWGYS